MITAPARPQVNLDVMQTSENRSNFIGRLIGLAVLSAATLASAEGQPPPEGCHWQSIPELKAHLPVPDGWDFQQRSEGDALIYEVTPGQSTAGPSLHTQFRMIVKRDLEPETVVGMAREFVQSVRSSGLPTAPMETQSRSTFTIFVSVVQMGDLDAGMHDSTVAVSAIANEGTGTLYLVRIDIPADELADIAPLTNHLFRTIRIDDEI